MAGYQGLGGEGASRAALLSTGDPSLAFPLEDSTVGLGQGLWSWAGVCEAGDDGRLVAGAEATGKAGTRREWESGEPMLACIPAGG